MEKIAEVIKYEGDNSTFIWKHPCEDFNSNTQLIVHESQEAVFFMNGQALDLFGAGRHTLETQNIPKIGKLLGRLTGGDTTPFHCEVYFINKTVQMGIKWGTDSKVRYLDPNLGIPLEIGACGEMNLAVSDSRKLLLKLVGTMNGIAWNENGEGFTKSIQSAFRPLISTAVKANLAGAIKNNAINILEIDEQLEKLSEVLRESIIGGFEEYGLTVPQFYVTGVVLPDNDPNFRRMKELHTVSFQTRMIHAEALVRSAQADAEAAVIAAKRKAELERQTTETEIRRRELERDVMSAQVEAEKTRILGIAEADVLKAQGFAEAETMAAKGYNQKDVLQAEVQKAYAESLGNINIGGSAGGGVGGIAGDMLGLGVSMAAAGAMAPQIGEMLKGLSGTPTAPTVPTAPTEETPKAKCTKCGAALPDNAKFCLECGEKITPPIPDGMTVCPSCGKTVAKGKFCLECGHKFITNCPSCGKEVPEGAKFCLECGTKL